MTAAPPLARRHATLWTARGWPALAGALTAAGLIADEIRWGWVEVIALTCLCFGFGFVMLLGALSAFGVGLSQSVRATFVGTIVLLVVVGLIAISPLVCVVAVCVATLTSPTLTGPLAGELRRRTTRRRLDRAFARIVADLESEPPWKQASRWRPI